MINLKIRAEKIVLDSRKDRVRTGNIRPAGVVMQYDRAKRYPCWCFRYDDNGSNVEVYTNSDTM